MRTQQAIVTTLLTVGLTSGAALLTGGCVDEYEQPKTVEPAPTEPMAPAPTPEPQAPPPADEPQASPPAEEPQAPPADQPQAPPKPQATPPTTEDVPAY